MASADKPASLRELWQSASPHLDRALAMTGDERAELLISIESQDPAMAGFLRMLIEEHRVLSDEHFLEEPLPLPSPPALAGQPVGAYTLISLIGQGGMGS